MERKVASYLTIGAITASIFTTIGCEEKSGSDPITTRSDAAKPAPDLGKKADGPSEASLVAAIEYASGANHDTPAVDQETIDDVEAMWRIASLTSTDKGTKAFVGTQGNEGVPIGLETEPPAYSDCDAEAARPEALNDLLPVLFQHVPGSEAKAAWSALRDHVRSGDVISVTCKDAPELIISVVDGRVTAVREALELSDGTERLEPSDGSEEGPPEIVDSLPEPPNEDDRPSGDLEVTSMVEGTSIVIDGTAAELPHEMTGIDPSKTIRFKVKAPAHLEAEVGALPMDVFAALQGGEVDTSYTWAVWPNPAPDAAGAE